MTSAAGARPSTQREWSTRPRARRAPGGSARRGTLADEQLVNSASVGIALVMSTVIGLAGGYYADRWLGTAPWARDDWSRRCHRRWVREPVQIDQVVGPREE